MIIDKHSLRPKEAFMNQKEEICIQDTVSKVKDDTHNMEILV